MRRGVAYAAVLAALSLGIVATRAQTTISTAEDYSKVMKVAAQSFGAANKAVGSGAYADARPELATARQNFAALQAFWTEKKRDDAIAIVTEALTKIDALDTLISATTVDQAAAQATAKEIQGSCAACHKLYREGDPKTGYRFRPGVL